MIDLHDPCPYIVLFYSYAQVNCFRYDFFNLLLVSRGLFGLRSFLFKVSIYLILMKSISPLKLFQTRFFLAGRFFPWSAWSSISFFGSKYLSDPDEVDVTFEIVSDYLVFFHLFVVRLLIRSSSFGEQ